MKMTNNENIMIILIKYLTECFLSLHMIKCGRCKELMLVKLGDDEMKNGNEMH